MSDLLYNFNEPFVQLWSMKVREEEMLGIGNGGVVEQIKLENMIHMSEMSLPASSTLCLITSSH